MSKKNKTPHCTYCGAEMVVTQKQSIPRRGYNADGSINSPTIHNFYKCPNKKFGIFDAHSQYDDVPYLTESLM